MVAAGHRSSRVADRAIPRQPLIGLSKLNRHGKWSLARFVLLAVVLFLVVLITDNQVRPTVPQNQDEVRSMDALLKENAKYITVYTQDGRRLGNLMFNVASLVGIAKRNRKIPAIPESFSLKDVFEITVKTAPDEKLGKYMLEYRESYGMACTFDPNTNQLPKEYGIVLKGFYQSWRYFDGFNDEIRSLFAFKPAIINQSRSFLQAARNQVRTSGDVVYIGIHVRRGDKKLYWWLWLKGYTTPPKEYYDHAMDYFERKFSNVIFIVCSNDIKWARENIRQSNQVVFSNFTNPRVDLALLSACNHTIISVGSFGWWGAWLANGQTVFYDYWPRPGSVLDKAVNKADYFLPGWTPMK